METVSITLSAQARETAFAICRNVKYEPNKLLSAASLIKKLREGTTPEQKMVQPPQGTVGDPIEVTIYKNFPDSVAVELTFEEKEILCTALKAIPQWHPDEADIIVELQTKLQIKLV